MNWFSGLLLLSLLAGRGGEGEGSSGGDEALIPERWGVPSAQALWRGAMASLAGLFDELPWWETPDFGLQVRLLLNKRFHCRPWPLLGVVLLVFILSAGRGGEGEVGSPTRATGMRQVFVLLRAHHAVDIDVAAIRGDGHLSRRADGALSTSKLEALDGDFGRRCTPLNQQVVCPRWLIAGGRIRDLVDDEHGGDDPGLDRVLEIPAGSFLLNAGTALEAFILQGSLCNLYPPFGF